MVQCSAEHYSAVQYSAVHYSAVHYILGQYNAEYQSEVNDSIALN